MQHFVSLDAFPDSLHTHHTRKMKRLQPALHAAVHAELYNKSISTAVLSCKHRYDGILLALCQINIDGGPHHSSALLHQLCWHADNLDFAIPTTF